MQRKKLRRRHRQLADARTQWAVAGRFILHMVTFMVVASFIGLVVQVLGNPFRPLSTQFSSFWSNHGPYLAVMIVMLPIFVWDTFKLTNRVVGPFCRLRSTIRSIAQDGQPRTVSFRKADYWKELAEDFNGMIERLDGSKTSTQTAEPDEQASELAEVTA
jgi:hypothetical protein